MAGLPATLHLDNGREFHSEALSRGCEQYDIALEYRPVRTPHYGGHIERLIGTMMGTVHLLPGTTFSDIEEKGDMDHEATAALTLDELERWLATAIVGVYHETLHRGIGTTPAMAWRRAIENTKGEIRQVDPSQARRLFVDFLPMERRLVRRDGIVLRSIHYWSDVLTTWIGEPNRLLVRYDPRNLSRIFLLGPDGTYYEIPYRDLGRPAISIWEKTAALRRLRAEGYRTVDESALFAAIDRMRRIAAQATTETKMQRRQRERQRQRTKDTPVADAPERRCETPSQPVLREVGLFTSVEEWT